MRITLTILAIVLGAALITLIPIIIWCRQTQPKSIMGSKMSAEEKNNTSLKPLKQIEFQTDTKAPREKKGHILFKKPEQTRYRTPTKSPVQTKSIATTKSAVQTKNIATTNSPVQTKNIAATKSPVQTKSIVTTKALGRVKNTTAAKTLKETKTNKATKGPEKTKANTDLKTLVGTKSSNTARAAEQAKSNNSKNPGENLCHTVAKHVVKNTSTGPLAPEEEKLTLTITNETEENLTTTNTEEEKLITNTTEENLNLKFGRKNPNNYCFFNSVCCLLENFPDAFSLENPNSEYLKKWKALIDEIKKTRLEKNTNDFVDIMKKFILDDYNTIIREEKGYPEIKYERLSGKLETNDACEILGAILNETNEKKIEYKEIPERVRQNASNPFSYASQSTNCLLVCNSGTDEIAEKIKRFDPSLKDEEALKSKCEYFLEKLPEYLYILWTTGRKNMGYEEFLEIGEEIYSIIGFVTSNGDDSDNNHYMAFIKTSNGEWVRVNDDWVTKTNFEKIKKANSGGSRRFLLYRKE